MHAGDNRTKGKDHAAFFEKHQEVDEAKQVWIAVSKKHM
jgi:hypothetical protein